MDFIEGAGDEPWCLHLRFRRGVAMMGRQSVDQRRFFPARVRGCLAPLHGGRLVGGGGFAIDASVMEADASRYRGVAGNQAIDWSDPTLNTRAVREYLAGLDPEPDPARKPPKVVSLSDPCSAWTAKANKRVLFGYGLNNLFDNGARHYRRCRGDAGPDL